MVLTECDTGHTNSCLWDSTSLMKKSLGHNDNFQGEKLDSEAVKTSHHTLLLEILIEERGLMKKM